LDHTQFVSLCLLLVLLLILLLSPFVVTFLSLSFRLVCARRIRALRKDADVGLRVWLKKESSWSVRVCAGSQGIPTDESNARYIRTQAFLWAGDGWTRMNLENKEELEVTYGSVRY